MIPRLVPKCLRMWWRTGVRAAGRPALICAIAITFGESEMTAWSASSPEFNPAAAREYLNQVLQAVEPACQTNARACFVAAKTRSQLGEKEQAERLARRALELDPARADVRVFLANLLILQDRMKEAAEQLKEAVRLDPQTPGGHRRLGMVLVRLGDRAGGQQALETAVRQAPTDATARFLLGQMLFEAGELGSAEEHLRNACRGDTNQAGAFYLLSQVQQRAGKSREATASLQRFQQLKREERLALDAKVSGYDDEKFMRSVAATFHNDLADVCFRQGQPKEGEAHLRQAIFFAPDDPEPCDRLAGYLIRTRRIAEAEVLCRKLVTLLPNDAGHRVNLGTLLVQMGQADAGIAELKRARELDANQPQALNNLARAYLAARRDLPEALALSQRLAEAHPIGESYDLLGWAYYANGKTNEARAAAAQAVKLDPTNAVYRQRLQRLQQLP
ncbi:MAG: tetratricopeptide repeat protein [Verrucomicrobiia bacterium]